MPDKNLCLHLKSPEPPCLKQESPPVWNARGRTAHRVASLQGEGVPTLDGGTYLGLPPSRSWLGGPALAAGGGGRIPTLGYSPILTWPGGTYLWTGVPTLAYPHPPAKVGPPSKVGTPCPPAKVGTTSLSKVPCPPARVGTPPPIHQPG